MSYKTVAKAHTFEQVIKGSRFIARVQQIESVEAFDAMLGEAKSDYADASHHCYAYKLLPAMRFSDDGEPGGTAGRPMLEVLEKRELDHLGAVVTRYFGGTRLGAGGLVRAYSGTLAKAIDEAGELLVKDRTTLVFEVPFDLMDSVHRFLATWTALQKGEMTYSATGMRLELSLFCEDEEPFKEALSELSRGQLTWFSGNSSE